MVAPDIVESTLSLIYWYDYLRITWEYTRPGKVHLGLIFNHLYSYLYKHAFVFEVLLLVHQQHAPCCFHDGAICVLSHPVMLQSLRTCNLLLHATIVLRRLELLVVVLSAVVGAHHLHLLAELILYLSLPLLEPL